MNLKVSGVPLVVGAPALVVALDDARRAPIVDALRSVGLVVAVADSFASARRCLIARPPSVLVTETRLGTHHGLHLALIGRCTNRHMAVVVTSEHRDPVLERDAEALGVAFLYAPVTAAGLLAALAGHASSGAAASETAAPAPGLDLSDRGLMKAMSRRSSQILVVDDHPLVRLGVRQLVEIEPDLSICGEADTHTGALEAVGASHPDLVVVDLRLGSASGLELIRELREVHPGVPVLVLTMHDETSFAERALDAGARGYVVKQDASSTLIRAIREVLAGRVYVARRVPPARGAAVRSIRSVDT